MSNTSKVYEAALSYAAKGMPVIPIAAGQKRCTLEGWPQKATTDSAMLAEWFPTDPFFGSPNIGIVTGQLLRDGRRLMVLDVDPKNGGDNSLAALEGEHGPLVTRTATTPSGGQHLYFGISADRDVKNSTSKVGKGLDIRGHHGYVAAAPSVTDKGAYTWDDESAPIADAPEWLVMLATEPRTKSEAPKSEASNDLGEVHNHGLTLEDARQMLKHLGSHVDDYQSWADVLWSLRRMARGRQDGSAESDWLQLADEWSRGSSKYGSRQDVENKWLEADKRSGFGARHLVELAKAGGWKPTAEQESRIGGRVATAAEFDAIPASAISVLPDKPERAPLQLIAPPDSLLMSILPERDWAIRPYFPRRTTALLLSVGGLGKTTLFLLLAICKALGVGLPDCGIDPPEPGRVVILSAEDDLEEMLRRLQRVLRELMSRGVKLDMQRLRKNLQIADLTGAGADNMLVRSEHLGAAATDFASHIAKGIGQADIIAIDTLSRFSGASENDNVAGAVFVSACESIARQTGAAVVILAHTGKQVAREGLVDQYVARGASSFSDNARSVLVLASPSKEVLDKYEIDEGAANQGDVFRVAHVKSNYARRAPDLYFERLGNGVVLPFTPKQKESPTEDALVLRLIGWIGKAEIRRNEMRTRYLEVFGNDVTRVQAFEVFDRAIRGGQLKLSRRINNADYYVVDASMKTAADAPMRQSVQELV